MSEVAYSIDDAVTDLVEAPASVPAAYDPGTLDNAPATPASRGSLTIEEGAALIDDVAPNDRAAAFHNGRPLTQSQLLQGYHVSANLAEVLGDIHSRYRWVQEAGENVFIGTNAVAELIIALFPPPHISLASTDPLEYTRAKVVHEEAHDVVLQIISYAQSLARQQADWASNQISKDTLDFEKACFLESYLEATNPEWMAQFKARITNAAESFGFYESEVDRVIDHRQLKVLDYVASTLEKRQGSAKREGGKPVKRPGPRLVSSSGDLTMSEALALDFD